MGDFFLKNGTIIRENCIFVIYTKMSAVYNLNRDERISPKDFEKSDRDTAF